MSEEQKTGSLAARLREHLSRERRVELETVEGLEALMRQHLEAARTQWPTLPLSNETFLRHLALQLPAGKVSEVMRILQAADLYLSCACATGESCTYPKFGRCVRQCVKASERDA